MNPRQTEEQRLRASAITILLVDDDPDYRMLLRDAVQHANPYHDVREAAGGLAAMEYLLACLHDDGPPRPGVVYLDLDMPGMSGQRVLEHVKGDAELKQIPVVVMTGLDSDEQKARAAASGANSYVLKPIDAVDPISSVLQVTDYWTSLHQRPSRPYARSA